MSHIVSLVVPCYNMASKIHRLFDSILRQTYNEIEVILIDDGSTDNIEEIIKSYEPRFLYRGITFNYVKKNNGGLGSAINTGLKLVHGEFLSWPDADDYLTDDSIEKKADFLIRHPDYNLVRSDAAVFRDGNFNKCIGSIAEATKSKFIETDLVKRCLAEYYFPYCPGCHMVRMSALIEVNPNLDIFEGKRGQNIQLLLPLIYRFKFAYIDEKLYNYIIYDNSMSRGDDTYEKCLSRSYGLHQIKIETLKRMIMDEGDFEYYKSYTEQYYYHKRCLDALKFNQWNDYNLYYSKLVEDRFIQEVENALFLKRHPIYRFFKSLLRPRLILSTIYQAIRR